MRTRIAVLGLAALIGAVCLVVDEHSLTAPTGAFISAAQARVGRPLTPMSVAGVARRTARRCAAGVYYC